ncbi:glycoside hydrolase family 2 [Bacteroides sp. 214]|uniref:glycoside hydrolase family 2 TIM barrel-domain containing protein n=1 Tax=Bacteroides sp. 214 TaxID=2302935 RepID=UPI0013D00189|nr:glycoside hydrolase family 2 TIM barrel-domain containing protein [Bacteroides sp. 214]NDW11482.1 glycoside hydrolase family 2 [Bacteroides sp. 214]
MKNIYKSGITLLFLLLLCRYSYAQEHLSLNGSWRFALAKTPTEATALAEFYLPTFDDSKFDKIPVPSNWAVLGYEEPVYRGFKDNQASEGFYLHEFTIPKGMGEKRVLLHFGGVWSSAEVWLNGHYLGRYDSGYTSFAFDVTGKLNGKGKNSLAVRVRQVTRDYKSDTFDDWTLGGIYRDVTLESMPRDRYIDMVTAQTMFDNEYRDADLKIRTMISDRQKNTLPGNYSSPGEPYDLRVTLTNKEGKEVVKQQLTIPAHISTDREVSLTLRVQAPHHWNAETPYLYNLTVELLERGNISHTRTERIGFREISTTGGVFRINGQAVKLRGVNRHDEHPEVGRATTREHWLQDITMMKAANINYIRMAHYTHARGFIELCDEMGMYVGNEVSLGGASMLMYDPSFAGAVLQRSYDTVIRDINSPSIIYWSVGNEDPLTSLHMAGVKTVKSIDPTRPVLLPWRAECWLPEEIDILAPHYWHPSEYDELAAQSTRPIITTEYTHAFGTHGFGGLEARWKALTKHPAGAGGAIWMWADQGIKTPVKLDNPNKLSDGNEYLRIDENGWDGIVDSYRNITQDYLETKAVYAYVYPAVNTVSFVPGEASVRIPIQNEYDFTNLSNVKITWSIREDAKELASGITSVEGKPHSTAIFKLPLEVLKSVEARKIYYAWLTFTNTQGIEICRKAVELRPSLELPMQVVRSTTKPTVINGETVIIQANDIRYLFDSKTGHLVSGEIGGKQLITELKPTIWRTPDRSETSVIGRQFAREAGHFNKFTPSVEVWNIEESATTVIISTKVKYIIDTKNSFVATYCYTIGADGKLDVHYEFLTNVSVPSLPVVGMEMKTVKELDNLYWLGLGPYNGYPNKQSAAILGVWGGVAGTTETIGTKVTRWIERSGSAGKLHITNIGYMEHSAANPEVISILSGVAARPEKGRKADDSFPRLLTDELFVGGFTVELMK